MLGEWARENTWVLAIAAVAAVLLAMVIAFVVVNSPSDTHRSDVEPRHSLAEYSWEDLSAISADIAQCGSESEAIMRAADYWLCRENGSIDETQAKAIELADGTTVSVALAGVWHDTRTDGGKAGLTFALVDAVSTHAMNEESEKANGSSASPGGSGGWDASEMRSWLQRELLSELPEDLSSQIVSVQKRYASGAGAGTGSSGSEPSPGEPADGVAETSDKLWLFSASELCGNIPANDIVGVDEEMTRVYSDEGAQYQRFQHGGVQAFVPSELLQRTVAGKEKACTWWLRTKTLESGDGFWLVGTDGTVLNGTGEDSRVVEDPDYKPKEVGNPDQARGVVVGFCL
ncbi:MAG: DUF6273 domain-containing protein [Coriobacteriia bacterium]|nr:DUF6273 domain-containing protein [Coriobacteriia bacterium]